MGKPGGTQSPPDTPEKRVIPDHSHGDVTDSILPIHDPTPNTEQRSSRNSAEAAADEWARTMRSKSSYTSEGTAKQLEDRTETFSTRDEVMPDVIDEPDIERLSRDPTPDDELESRRSSAEGAAEEWAKVMNKKASLTKEGNAKKLEERLRAFSEKEKMMPDNIGNPPIFLEDGRVRCPQCQKISIRPSAYHAHFSWMHTYRELKCHKCGTTCHSRHGLATHKQAKHPKRELGKSVPQRKQRVHERIPCPDCSVMVRRAYLTNHRRRKHGALHRAHCEICNEAMLEGDIKEHMDVVHAVKSTVGDEVLMEDYSEEDSMEEDTEDGNQ
ncbi:MAG: hypothetical protein M1814_004809 [Vezdaea aestivalis]|nr:MAG: hypothetical protein M1814_004809 [Vezdaea aestivalis]